MHNNSGRSSLLVFLLIFGPLYVLHQTARNNYNAALTCMVNHVEYGETAQAAAELCER